MPIPAFDANGYLPAGKHLASEAEVEDALVTPFTASNTRRPIFERWQHHRKAIADYVPIKEQWLNGSFVTDKRDPADLDVVTLYEGSEWDPLPTHKKMVLETLLLHKYTVAYWKVDSYPIAIRPPGHPHHSQYQNAVAYWDDWWGHDRAQTPKGYVVVA